VYVFKNNQEITGDFLLHSERPFIASSTKLYLSFCIFDPKKKIAKKSQKMFSSVTLGKALYSLVNQVVPFTLYIAPKIKKCSDVCKKGPGSSTKTKKKKTECVLVHLREGLHNLAHHSVPSTQVYLTPKTQNVFWIIPQGL